MDINIIPEKLLIKMWDSLDNSIGSLLKPWQIKREGRALLEVRREEILILAQTQKDAESIQNKNKQFNNYKLQSITDETSNTSLNRDIGYDYILIYCKKCIVLNINLLSLITHIIICIVLYIFRGVFYEAYSRIIQFIAISV